MTDEQTDTRYSLTELAEAAGVSVRTVRYYIAEGLLPPPVTAGPRSHYARAHLDRLRLIGRLKRSYLPLREIRRHLTGLDEEEVQHLLATPGEEPAAALEMNVPYADTVASTSDPHSQSRSMRLVESPIDSAASYIARVMSQTPTRPAASPTPQRPITHHPSPITHQESSAWRRVPLGDDAELLIREEAYQRKHDRIDWLVDWARKVLD